MGTSETEILKRSNPTHLATAPLRHADRLIDSKLGAHALRYGPVYRRFIAMSERFARPAEVSNGSVVNHLLNPASKISSHKRPSRQIFGGGQVAATFLAQSRVGGTDQV